MGEEVMKMPAFEQFLLHLEVHATTVVAAFEPLWASVRRVLGITRAARWQTLKETPISEDDLVRRLAELASTEATEQGPLSIDAELGASPFNFLHVHGHGEHGGTRWTIKVKLDGTKPVSTVTWKPTALLADIARELFRSGMVRGGWIEIGGTAACVPSVPIAESERTMVITTEAEVAEHFERPAAFWGSWSSCEQHGDLRMLVRCEEAMTSPGLLRCVQLDQWAMVRALRPGHLPSPRSFGQPRPDEVEVFEGGEPRLDVVGYLPKSRTLEMSCARTAGEHVHGWEIYRLGRMLKKGSTPDGKPIEAVRIVFLHEAAAREEKRALLEYRLQVFYMGDDGEPVQIRE